MVVLMHRISEKCQWRRRWVPLELHTQALRFEHVSDKAKVKLARRLRYREIIGSIMKNNQADYNNLKCNLIEYTSIIC